MGAGKGLRTALNEIRETSIDSDTLYAKHVEEILPSTSISEWCKPILEFPKVMNEFVSELIQKVIYTQIETKMFRNPLAILDGDIIPLGSIGEEIFINPVVGRKFNVTDFAGLLAMYEADVKVQYQMVNSDIQYPISITKAKLKNAFVSWEQLQAFIEGYTMALYNGCYIDRYNMTKGLVSTAYSGNNVQIEVVNSPIGSDSYAKAMIEKMREAYLNFQTPTTKYNAWAKVGGYGNEIITFTPKEDIVVLIRNDVLSAIDVNVLASAFNIDKTTLLGNIIGVNDFDLYEYIKQADGSQLRHKIYDGSKILGIVCDKRWFRIKQQDFEMDEFYNANNRVWNKYLNDVRLYGYSLFANAVVFATEMPVVEATKVEFLGNASFELAEGATKNVFVQLTPTNTTATITFTSATPAVVKAEKISNTEVKLTGMDANVTAVTITASDGTHSDTISVTCVAGT